MRATHQAVVCFVLRRAKPSSSAGAASSSSSPQQQDQQWDPATAGITDAIGIGCGKRDDLRKVWQQHKQQQASGADAAGASRPKPLRVPRISNECEVGITQVRAEALLLPVVPEQQQHHSLQNLSPLQALAQGAQLLGWPAQQLCAQLPDLMSAVSRCAGVREPAVNAG